VIADARSRALSAVAKMLTRGRGRRVTLADLEAVVVQAVPDVGAGASRRELIGMVVGTLSDAGEVVLPRTGAAWEPGVPPLPRWVVRSAEPPPTGRRLRRFPWRVELEWATNVPLTDAQFDALQAVQAWMRDRRVDDPPNALRERSVDVFGDDKRLQALLGGPLFAPGRLTLELMDCVVAYPPLAVRDLLDGAGNGESERRRGWLVVENGTTFRTLSEHTNAVPEVGLLIYGAGAQAQAGLPALLADHARPDTVWWFGDVDRDGLRFAAGAASALEVEGLDVLPHRPLYRALVARGVVADSQVAPMDATGAAELAAWLADGDLERFAVAVLRSGRRAMQEQVGPRELGRLEAVHDRAV
jgi:hypothetical protein